MLHRIPYKCTAALSGTYRLNQSFSNIIRSTPCVHNGPSPSTMMSAIRPPPPHHQRQQTRFLASSVLPPWETKRALNENRKEKNKNDNKKTTANAMERLTTADDGKEIDDAAAAACIQKEFNDTIEKLAKNAHVARAMNTGQLKQLVTKLLHQFTKSNRDESIPSARVIEETWIALTGAPKRLGKPTRFLTAMLSVICSMGSMSGEEKLDAGVRVLDDAFSRCNIAPNAFILAILIPFAEKFRAGEENILLVHGQSHTEAAQFMGDVLKLVRDVTKTEVQEDGTKSSSKKIDSLIHPLMQRGIQMDNVVYATLIDAAARGRQRDKMFDIWRHMVRHGCRVDSIVTRSLLDGLVEQRDPIVFDIWDKCLELEPSTSSSSSGASEMESSSVKDNEEMEKERDAHIITDVACVIAPLLRTQEAIFLSITMLKACASFMNSARRKGNYPQLAQRYVQDVQQRNIAPNREFCNAILSFYLAVVDHTNDKQEQAMYLQRARQIVEHMEQSDIAPNQITNRALLALFINCGDISSARKLFQEQVDAKKVTVEMLNTMLIMCLNRRTKYKNVLSIVQSHIHLANYGTFGLLFDIAGEHNAIDVYKYALEEWSAFNDRHQKTISPEKNQSVFVHMLSAMVQLHQSADDVEKLVQDMTAAGNSFRKDSEVFSILVQCNARHGMFSQGMAAFEEYLTQVGKSEQEPHVDVFNSVLQLYALQGDVDGARNVIETMSKAHHVQPNTSTFYNLLSVYLSPKAEFVSVRDLDECVDMMRSVSTDHNTDMNLLQKAENKVQVFKKDQSASHPSM